MDPNAKAKAAVANHHQERPKKFKALLSFANIHSLTHLDTQVNARSRCSLWRKRRNQAQKVSHLALSCIPPSTVSLLFFGCKRSLCQKRECFSRPALAPLMNQIAAKSALIPTYFAWKKLQQKLQQPHLANLQQNCSKSKRDTRE